MKKRVFTVKKINKIRKKRRQHLFAARWAAVMAVLWLLTGTVLTVCGMEQSEGKSGETAAEELSRTVVTDILHKHMGTPDVQGGCYTSEIEHHHQGDKENGGECYQIPVPHEHQGSADTGGGCYGEPVWHTHREDCYVKHVHEASCFQSVECMEEYTEIEPFETFEKNCLHHGMTTFDRARAVVIHSVCGKDPENVTISYCQICGPHFTMHTKQEKLCGYEEGDPEEDHTVCGREGAIDGYEENCGFREGETEFYDLSCNRKADGYETGCGLAQGEKLGRLILTGRTKKGEGIALISAKVEDLSGGRLILSGAPYRWQDENGNVIGEGESVEVKENGIYSVTLKLENKDVEETGLRSSISIDDLFKEETESSPHPSKEPTASAQPSGKEESGGGKEEEKDPGDKDDKEDVDTEKGEEQENAAIDTVTADSSAAKEKTNLKEKETGSLSGSIRKEIAGSGGEKHLLEKQSAPTPSASPQNQIHIKKKTDMVKAKENKAEKEVAPRIKQAEKGKGFFNLPPAVKMITVTAGTLLLLAGALLLFIYLRRSVRIYNDDGTGDMRYLGRCMVYAEEEEEKGYFLTIGDVMVEKSYTNRYCIRPGLFRLGKEEGQELVVYKEAKKAVATLSREIIVMI